MKRYGSIAVLGESKDGDYVEFKDADKAMQFIGHLLYDHIPTDDLSKCQRCLEAKAMHDAHIGAVKSSTVR